MLLRLSRASFWLAAVVAAVGLFAPAAYATALLVVVSIASAVAYGSWRAAVRAPLRQAAAPASVPAEPALDAAALREAGSELARRIAAAPDLEAALHVAARQLRGELGAREAAVHEVVGADAGQARLRTMVEAQPGFRMVERRIELASGPLGRAIATRAAAGAPPLRVALPVCRGGQVVAVLELGGFELAIEPAALASLLDSAATALQARAAEAAAPAAAGVPGIADNRRMLVIAPHAPALQDHGFDDSHTPMGAPGLHGMLKPGRRVLAAAGDGAGSGAPEPSATLPSAAVALDPAALERLAELDPSGANHLIERVLGAFQASAARLRPQAAAARASGDRPTLRLVAHTLKSSSASIGANHLSQLCAQIEAAICADEGANLDAELDAFDTALDAVLAAIARRLEPRG